MSRVKFISGLILIFLMAFLLPSQTDSKFDKKKIYITDYKDTYLGNVENYDRTYLASMDNGGFAVTWKYQLDQLLLGFFNEDGKALLDEPVLIKKEGLKVDRSILLNDLSGGLYHIYRFFSGSGQKAEILVNRYDSKGKKLWGEDGKVVATGPWNELATAVATDNGLQVYYNSISTDEKGNTSLYMNIIDKDGVIKYGEDEKQISTTRGFYTKMVSCADSEGGVVLMWEAVHDEMNPYSSRNMEVQRVDKEHNPVWNGGKPIVLKKCTRTRPNSTGDRVKQKLVASGEKIWFMITDSKYDGENFVQKSEATEVYAFNIAGRSVASPKIYEWQNSADIVPDNRGGVFVVTYRYDYVTKPLWGSVVRVHHIDKDMKEAWGREGIEIKTSLGVMNTGTISCSAIGRELRLYLSDHDLNMGGVTYRNLVYRISEDGSLQDGADGFVTQEHKGYYTGFYMNTYNKVSKKQFALFLDLDKTDGFSRFYNYAVLIIDEDIKPVE